MQVRLVQGRLVQGHPVQGHPVLGHRAQALLAVLLPGRARRLAPCRSPAPPLDRRAERSENC